MSLLLLSMVEWVSGNENVECEDFEGNKSDYAAGVRSGSDGSMDASGHLVGPHLA
jgi:hypothetical protein